MTVLVGMLLISTVFLNFMVMRIARRVGALERAVRELNPGLDI
jgi:HAMP domain-containing protein